MSAQDERGALSPRPSLYDYALRLYRAEPEGRFPKGGHPLPDRPSRQGRNRSEVAKALATTLTPLLTDLDTVRAADEFQRRLDELGVQDHLLYRYVAELPLDDKATARALSRHLTRTGTSNAAVSVGIDLLARLGEPEDVPFLKILGLLRGFTLPVVRALTRLDSSTAALLWLGGFAEGRELRHLIDALVARDDPAVRAWLMAIPLEPRAAGPETARRIAEAVRLADIAAEDPGDPRALAQGARLLVRMTSVRDYQAEILVYPQAVAAYDAIVARVSRLLPTLDNYAALLSLVLDLDSGPSVLLDWRPGQREALLHTLEHVLKAPAWAAVPAIAPDDAAARRRADWARRTAQRLFAHRTAPARFRVEVAVRDPLDPDTVETRFLIDGRPLVPDAFGRGPGNSPEDLLDTGRLRAEAEPREVQLAEAYCTEGCCGALYVTICREGEHVVWRDWRRPAALPSRRPAPELPEYRFDAAEYDAEIAHAENDRSWAWPARDTAWRIAAGLRDRPELLVQWDGRLGWVGTDFLDPDTAVLSFTYWPGLAAGQRDKDGPWLQFIWSLPDDGTPPEEQAAAALRRLSAEDPKNYAEVRGGSREYAEVLGYPWPEHAE
ncbi:hypothetical protein GCM10010191_03010 [Actinomadura vinacea]|uniref:HEAT repeat domain-containing protein n=1 Tax=Actinomadura vinacea TaxID=115336 RepID=A0ABN3ICT4_9ACTN